MAELLQVIESIRTEEQRTRAVFTSEDGTRIRRMRSPQYLAVLAEAVTLVADVYAGKKGMHYLQEAMTTSDFPILFGDIIDRMLLAKYKEIAPSYSAYVKIATVRDFREVSRKALKGGRGLMTKVGEKAPYPVRAYGEAEYKYAVSKYGARMDFSWEDLINDDLDALKDAPGDLAIAARRTEEYFATDMFVDENGPDATFFSVANGNLITGNPVLSVAGLQKAMETLAAQKDADGRPIVITAAVLVVPPSLEIAARNILNALQIEMTESGGTAGQKIVAQNWMKNAVRLVVNYEIPNIATTNGKTSWFLFQDPNVGRPALEMGFLRGHVEPEVFMKEPNARRVGGGQVNPLDGDFDTDSVEYKVRHVLGGTPMDPKAAVASNGSGS